MIKNQGAAMNVFQAGFMDFSYVAENKSGDQEVAHFVT
jgi:hypothetical protein